MVLGRTIVSQLFWWRHRLKIHVFLSKAGRPWTILPWVSLSRYLGGQGFIIFNTLLLTVSPLCSLESMRTTREIEGSMSMLVFKIQNCSVVGKQWCRHSLVPRLLWNEEGSTTKKNVSFPQYFRWENKYLHNILVTL